jgi:hypothetical protein
MFPHRDESPTARARWGRYASILFLVMSAGSASYAVGGCSSESPDATAAGAGAATLGSPPPSATCTRANANQLSFSTTLACSATNVCPAERLALDATTQIDPATGGATTTWTIRNASAVVLRETIQAVKGRTQADITFGPGIQAPAHTSYVDDGTTLTWTIDGRVARASRTGVNAGKPVFADGKPAPTIGLSANTHAAIAQVLAQARAEAKTACAGSAALAALEAALPSGAHAATPTLTHSVSTPLPGAVAPVAPAVILIPPPSPTPHPLAGPGTAPGQGLPPDFNGSTHQNNLIDWETPNCTSCQQGCTTSWECSIAPGCEQLCEAGCFTPSIGGCAQNVCPIQNGFATCDNDQQCCGSVCCGPGTVCGDPSLGVCCPSANPVACGDQTQQGCFPAGSTCCGFDDACPPGNACINTPGNSATCCPPAQATKSGACCEKETCGGECCDTGTCHNGSCCVGTVTPSGQCCGLTQSVCNGQCCNGSCTGSGACCATGSVVCGSACCGSGQVCLNASTSTCGAPTGPTLTLSDSGGVLGHSGGGVIRVLTGIPYTLTGQAWSPGTVTIDEDSTTGTKLGSATASGGATSSTFSTTITFNLPLGAHSIVAFQKLGSLIIPSTISVSIEAIQ